MLIEVFGTPLFSEDFAEQTDAAVGDGLRRRADENSNFRWLEKVPGTCPFVTLAEYLRNWLVAMVNCPLTSLQVKFVDVGHPRGEAYHLYTVKARPEGDVLAISKRAIDIDFKRSVLSGSIGYGHLIVAALV